MQEITQKVKAEVLLTMQPVIEEMAKVGMDEDQIVNTFKRHIDAKIKQYYRKMPVNFSEIVKNIKFENAGSKADTIFYDMPQFNKIPFKYQYPIGPYKADYLFNDFLNLELDGPQHETDHDSRRDKYMRRMGYKVLRVPIWILAMNPEAIIEEIKEQIMAG